jgi:hypothetical protein
MFEVKLEVELKTAAARGIGAVPPTKEAVRADSPVPLCLPVLPN